MQIDWILQIWVWSIFVYQKIVKLFWLQNNLMNLCIVDPYPTYMYIILWWHSVRCLKILLKYLNLYILSSNSKQFKFSCILTTLGIMTNMPTHRSATANEIKNLFDLTFRDLSYKVTQYYSLVLINTYR